MSIGDLGPLLPYMLHGGLGQGRSDGSGTGDGTEVLPTSFQEYLSTLAGQRVKIYVHPQDFVEWVHGSVFIARVVAVDGNYLILENIVIDGVPQVDPRRMALTISTIDGVERLSERQILLETLLDLC